MEAKITEALHEPCERPAPTGDDPAAHTHDDDGRVCAWDDAHGEWLTVRAVPKEQSPDLVMSPPDIDLPAYPPAPDQKEVGIYPKFFVRRIDGRDQDGGDREDAKQGYFVLDPVFDPAARPALALYSMLARQMGYEKLADDLDHNLRVLAQHVGAALEQGAEPDPKDVRPLRAVATWTYDATREHYLDPQAAIGLDNCTADVMAGVDQRNYAENTISIDDVLSLATDDPDVRILPNA